MSSPKPSRIVTMVDHLANRNRVDMSDKQKAAPKGTAFDLLLHHSIKLGCGDRI
jgi:hypothetical protein